MGHSPDDESLGANTLYGVRIQIGGSGGTLRALGIVLTVANGENGHVRLGLYRDQGGSPQTLVSQTGALGKVNGETEGLVSPAAVSPGYYWLMFLADTTFRPGVLSSTDAWLYKSFVFNSLPNTAPAMTGATLGIPYVYAVVTPNPMEADY